MRGRYRGVHLTLYGRAEHDAASVAAEASLELACGQEELEAAAVPPTLHVPLVPQHHDAAQSKAATATTLSIADDPPKPPQLQSSSASLLPIADFTPALLAHFKGALQYYRLVGRSHGRIMQHPPGDRLLGCTALANAVCRALAGAPVELEMALGKSPRPGESVPPVHAVVEMAVEWCHLLAMDRWVIMGDHQRWLLQGWWMSAQAGYVQAVLLPYSL